MGWVDGYISWAQANEKMTKREEYNIKYWNPEYWFSSAERNKYSASILLIELNKRIYKLNNKIPLGPEEDEEFISICYSYFLLIGLSLENLVKGLIISKCTDYTDDKKNSSNKVNYGWNNSHFISKMIETNFRSLNDAEKEFILKIEKYLRWLSKYHLPMKQDEEETNKLINSNDSAIFERMYKEMELMLQANWQKNELIYENWREKLL